MYNNALFFHVYLLIILFALSIVSFFLSRYLLRLVFNNLKLFFLFNNLKTQINLNTYDYTSLFSLYVFRGNLFLSVALSELILEINSNFIQKDLIYNTLAYFYYHNSFYSISEYYCFKILSISPYNDKVILNLANMYSDLGYKTKANNMFIRSSKLESNNLFSK
uniref:hypothetical protein n=1 Tax=Amplisiphonia pacifica TaxID=1563190 RepID=UPI0022FD85FE|nr:hypothetical protein PNY92_pgp191 [Amplisiphonia pacifica]WAX03197.1 hypothetical protein [Amplisiphonia pacifica]